MRKFSNGASLPSWCGDDVARTLLPLNLHGYFTMPTSPADTDLQAMRLAIEASERAIGHGDGPFGATLVSPDGEILLVASNNVKTADDCTGHAEMVLVREAQKKFGLPALRGATVVASGEPCAMCAGALFWAGVSRIVFGASQADVIRVLGANPAMPIDSGTTLAGAQPAVKIEGPLMNREACAVLEKAASQR
jgi:tRNA(adenine34) deaminase